MTRCAFGVCKSDSRYPKRLEGGIKFYPFPKPKTQEEKCRLWIKRCGRPHHQLNVSKINRNTYVCSKHFVNGRPTPEYPNPVQAVQVPNPRREHLGGCRKPPTKRFNLQDASTSSTIEAEDTQECVVDSVMEAQFRQTVDFSEVMIHSDFSEAVTVKTEDQESPLDEVTEAPRIANVHQSSNPNSRGGASDLCLPAGWIDGLPAIDQQWISKALFKWSPTGQPELDFSIVDKFWWYPPQPLCDPAGIPTLVSYFGHRLFLWLPVSLWHERVACPHEDCLGEELIRVGIHQQVKRVVSCTSSYFLATEELHCKNCKRQMTSWSHGIISQLHLSKQLQFPCLLTAGSACDLRVVRHQLGLRDPGGNGIGRIRRRLEEEHNTSWARKQLLFLHDFRRLMQTVMSGLDVPVMQGELLPDVLPVPKAQWLMQAYSQDLLLRLEDSQASITSHFGQVLRLSSTYKIEKVLASRGSSTIVSCATSIMNEHRQVIMSVLTDTEGCGLEEMVEGVVKRYEDTQMEPPKALFVDRDCCGTATAIQNMLRSSPWQNTEIRLDVEHFMQRFAAGFNTDKHALSGAFMTGLAQCIYSWDECDVSALKEAKRAELAEEREMQPSDADVTRHVTKADLALHCKRATRPSSEMEALITKLIQFYGGERGRDFQGVPLINSAKMADIWEAQKKHLPCLQDPPGVQVYTQRGTRKKGGHSLPTYRCARSFTLLERFHQYLNRFIPGTLANGAVFQAYMVEAIVRWNEDRTPPAAEGSVVCSNARLAQAVNELAQKVCGKTLVDCAPLPKYTGELIGVEYFYAQQCCILEHYLIPPSHLETEEVTLAKAEEEEKKEDYMTPGELEDPTIFSLELSSGLPPAPTSSRPPVLSVSPLPSSSTAKVPPLTSTTTKAPPLTSTTTKAVTLESSGEQQLAGAGAVRSVPVLSAGPMPVLLLPRPNPDTASGHVTHRLLLPATSGPLQLVAMPVPHPSQAGVAYTTNTTTTTTQQHKKRKLHKHSYVQRSKSDGL